MAELLRSGSAAFEAMGINEVYKLEKRKRVPLRVEAVDVSYDYEPIYSLGNFTAVEMSPINPRTEMTVSGPVDLHKGVFVEFKCHRCKKLHSRAGHVNQMETGSSGKVFYFRSKVDIGHLDQRCDKCVEYVQAREAAIQKLHQEAEELRAKILKLEEGMHDEKMLIEQVEEHPDMPNSTGCRICASRREDALEAQYEADEHDWDDDEEDEDD
jgi:hypothetical protein